MSKPPPTHPVLATAVRNCLRKEFADFMTEMMRPEGEWPAITDEQLVDALADALVEVGRRNNRGVALVQTLVYDLQDRINNTVKG